MPASHEILEARLIQAFPGAEISLKALVNDNEHWEVTVRSATFNGKSRIEQHRAVSDCVADLNIHALSIKSGTI